MFRVSFYFLVFFIFLSFNCLPKFTPPKFPDKKLEEVRLLGTYYPKDIEDKEKRRQKKYENCIWYWETMGHSNQWAIEYCNRVTNKEEVITEDSFNYSGINYCYNTKKDKEPVYDKKRVVRLYDEQGKVLAEDYVRCSLDLDGTANCDKKDSPPVNIYLPYYDEAHKLHIVSLREKKEFIVYKSNIIKQSILTDIDSPVIRHSYTYNEDLQCFISPPPL